MSENWAITPPSSPQVSKNKNGINCSELDSENAVLFMDDWSCRMFCCMGEPQNSIIHFHNESYLKKNDLSIFHDDESHSTTFLDDFGFITLFGFKFDKGSALIQDTDTLFSMAKHVYIHLDSAAKVNVSSLGSNLTFKKIGSYSKLREEIVNFLIYIRNFVQRVGSCAGYYWMIENLFSKLHDELTKFRVLCGSMDLLPDYIINYSSSSLGNRSTQPSYHLFHCQLDFRWLHLTISYQLISFRQKLNVEKCSEEYEASLNSSVLHRDVEYLVSDLIVIAFKRFQHISVEDLRIKSFFACTCVREMWKLVQLCVCLLNKRGLISCFWDFVNEICDKIMTNTIQENVCDCSSLKTRVAYISNNSPLFVVWLLKHLVKLWSAGEKMEVKSNYILLENALKICLNSELSESHLRIFLNFVENILNSDWEMRAEPLMLLWDYFHKKLNSLFFIPGSVIGDIAIVSKSASGWLTQLNSKLDQSVLDKNVDSFHIFLRILGRNLRRRQDNPRFWNQLKGRIFSKFSSSKLLTLNEIGLYHFISLFLTLAMTTDLQEVSKKLQYFLSLLNLAELDEARLKLIWKAHIALILLFAENNQDISSVSNPILDAVETAVQLPDRSCLMRTFTEGFQDLVDCTNNLELGQYLLVGNWISVYLSQCSDSDSNRFLETILLLINKLNSLMSAQLPVSQDNQLILMHDALWKNLVPYLKKISSSSQRSYLLPDVAAVLTALSLKSCFSQSVRSRGVDFLTFFVTNDFIDVRLLCRYLSYISRSAHLYSLNNLSITLIKGWLRCLILLSSNDESKDDLSTFTMFIITLPEMQKLFSDTQVVLNSDSDYFENFLIALQLKYSSLQDFHSKNKFMSQIWSYFANIERWLSHVIKTPKSINLAMNIYCNVGQMFFKIPEMLYTKSRPNTLLQSFIDLLLLPKQIRNPQFKLNASVSDAIRDTIYLFVCGLFKLDPLNDPYIYRNIKELLVVYVPRLVSSKGTILLHGGEQFSLSKCFDYSERFELMSKSIMEILCSTFIKKRAKTPHQFAYHVLMFFNNLIRSRRKNNAVVKCFIKNGLEKICDVVMFCDNSSPCKKEAKEILLFILDLHLIRSDQDVANELIEVFCKLSTEHLAFTSHALFDLFEEIVTVAPDFIARFLPQFTEKITEVERKRGVGFDPSLRKGLQRIENALKSIRSDQKANNHQN